MIRDEFRGGVIAEFDTADELLGAVHRLRSRGYRALDTSAPFDVPGLDEALDLPPSRIPWLVFAVGLMGAVFSYWVEWYTSAVSYPINAGGRPANAVPAFIMIAFEGLVLAGGFAALLGFMWANRLPRLWHPLFEVEGFGSASTDRFWVGIDARDPRFQPGDSSEALRALGPRRVVWVGGG